MSLDYQKGMKEKKIGRSEDGNSDLVKTINSRIPEKSLNLIDEETYIKLYHDQIAENWR